MKSKQAYLNQLPLRKIVNHNPKYQGFYMDNGDLFQGRWLKDNKAWVKLPFKPAKFIRIEGQFGFDREFGDAKKLRPIGLSVRNQGKKLGQNDFEQVDRFEWSFSVKDKRLRKGRIVFKLHKVNLRSLYYQLGVFLLPKSFTPQFIKKFLQGYSYETAKRRLKIRKIIVDDRVLIDFTSSGLNSSETNSKPDNLPGMNVVGYHRHVLGIGEGARLLYRTLIHKGIASTPVQIKVPCNQPEEAFAEVALLQKKNPQPINIFHIDPGQTELALKSHGESFYKNKYNIGFWAWELDQFPYEYFPAFHHLQEIWTPSEFCRKAFHDVSPVPVITIPHPVEFEKPKNVNREEFGIPKDCFAYLVLFDFGSFQVRKNPKGALEAFLNAFPKDEGVHLIIKVHNLRGDLSSFNELEERIAGMSHIHLLKNTFSREKVYELISACDAFLSLHRSEGFGLGLAEAMFLGKPVVSTDYSAPSEFINEQNGMPVKYELKELENNYFHYRAGNHWAEADLDYAANAIQKLAQDTEMYSRLSRNAAETIQRDFSYDAIGQRVANRLDSYLKCW